MADRHFTIAVIGAGPAGATTANALCIAGVDGVALIDKARFPRDKVCGDGITGAAADVMREIGLGHLLASHPLVERLVQTAPSGAQAVLEQEDAYPLPSTYVIPRKIFDSYLANAAIARGAADLTGHKLESLDWRNGRWHLDLLNTSSPLRLKVSADFLIGADGATSRVRRTLGLPMNADKHTGIAIRAYGTTSSRQTPQMRLEFIKGIITPGYAWLFSFGPNEVNIGFGTQLFKYKSQPRHLREVLSTYLAYLGDGVVLDAKSIQSGLLPLAERLPRLAVPERGAALIGDAASMINPFTGEGISYGMAAGLSLGRHLADAIAARGDLGAAAVRYEKDFRGQYGAHFRNNMILNRVLRSKLLIERLVGKYRRDPEYHRDAINMMLGGGERPSLSRLLLRGLFS